MVVTGGYGCGDCSGYGCGGGYDCFACELQKII
jgi:hypothetical protein